MIRVVIADDHGVVRSGLDQLLSTAGDIELVGSAADGAEAVAVVGGTDPDVVLMDLSMPVMDGPALVEALKAAAPRARVILSTGQEQPAWFAGPVLRKPFTFLELLSVLRRSLDA